jgi:anthranilate/para-aminobenzoate synthase component II
MKRALFVDFEDSFSYNVIQEISSLNIQVDVIHWQDFQEITDHDLLVLGPGPGHPEDYQRIFNVVGEWLKNSKKIFAVCLGHQILWHIMGAEVKVSQYPLHGQKVELLLDEEWRKWLRVNNEVWVQRYNSLAVMKPQIIPADWRLFLQLGEVVMTRSSQVISYQFHPESMGTNCRRCFFRPILRDFI